jgi:hypothetical protein
VVGASQPLRGLQRSRRLLGNRAQARPSSGAVIDVAIATLAVLLIASPLLFTGDGFAPDFTNAIWLADRQHHAIAANLHPTLFLQTQEHGVFYPLFAFYGATLFALTGALAVVLGGSTIVAFEVVTVAAIAAAYGGLFWLARQLGVKGLLAHAPAIVFVTSAYYVTNIYGRGAWAEFIAVSALPLVLAASLRLVRGRFSVGPVACLVAASVAFSGSHNITLLWGSTLALVALAIYWLLSGRSRDLPWRRMLGVAGLITLGVGVNGWFLLPDVSYGNHTIIGGEHVPWNNMGLFNTPGVIFDPLRTVPHESRFPALYIQTPVLALVWGLLAAPLAWRYRGLRAGVATALIVLAGVLVLMMVQAAWEALPNIYQRAQFTYRLETWVTLACAGLVLLGALALTRRAQSGRATRADRSLALGLGVVVAFGVALCTWQLWVPNTHVNERAPPGVCCSFASYANRGDVLRGLPIIVPESWNAKPDYADRSLRVLAPRPGFWFDPTHVQDDRLAGPVSVPAGLRPFATNVAGGPYLVHVGGGVRVVGRTERGELVLQRTTDGSQPVPVELSARLGAPVVLGRITTAVSAVLLLALAGVAAVRRRRRRRAALPAGRADGGRELGTSPDT